MISDVVWEYLVEKKRESSENLKSAGIVVGATALVFLLMLAIYYFPSLGAIFILLIFGIVYGAVKLLGRLAVEYEYCFVNGELTVDKIVQKSTRTHLATLNVKNVEKAGYYDAATFNSASAGNVLNYSDSDNPQGAVYLQFRDSNGYTTTLILSLREDHIERMKPHFNQLVYREAFMKR